MTGTDHWQHLAKEHGMNRDIAVQHVRSDRRGQDDADPWRIARKPPSDRNQRKSGPRGAPRSVRYRACLPMMPAVREVDRFSMDGQRLLPWASNTRVTYILALVVSTP